MGRIGGSAAGRVIVEPISVTPPRPVRHPAMRQSWRDLTFLHWRSDPSAIRPLVPAELQLDLYDGAAWVGLVPFLIRGPDAPACARVALAFEIPGNQCADLRHRPPRRAR